MNAKLTANISREFPVHTSATLVCQSCKRSSHPVLGEHMDVETA